jgi:predicted nucleotidyltransferase
MPVRGIRGDLWNERGQRLIVVLGSIGSASGLDRDSCRRQRCCVRQHRLSYGAVVEDLAHVVRQAVADLPVSVVWLFGSRARGVPRPGSDTDLALLLDADVPDPLALRLEVQARMSDLGVTDADVVVADDLPLRLRARVAAEGRVLLSRDEPARIAWISRVFREHADFALLQDELDRQMLAAHAAGRR